MLIGYLCLIGASVCWGSMGIFVRVFTGWGMSSLQIAAVRIISAAVLLAAVALIRDRRSLKIRPRDIPLFLVLGLGSILAMTVLYFVTIQAASLSVAAILLYTAPIMVMVMSVLFLKERFTLKKGIALAAAFGGCVLVAGIGGGGTLSPLGILAGLGSGFAYSLYSILGAVALRRYAPVTVTAYAFLFAALGAIFIGDIPGIARTVAASQAPLLAVGLFVLTGLVTAAIPFGLYTFALGRVEVGKASILVSLEPVVATLIGAIFFSEPVSVRSAIGIALVLGAVVLLSLRPAGSAKA